MNSPTLHARRAGFPSHYDISDGASTVATVSGRTVRRGGDVVIDGRRHVLESSALGRTYRLDRGDGGAVAVAEHDRSGWTITAGGRTYRLPGGRAGSTVQVLGDDAGHVGEIRRSRRAVDADLPGLERPVAVFVLLLAVASSQRRRRVVATAR